MTASLLTLAKDNGLTRVDQVLFNEGTNLLPATQNLFVVQFDAPDPARLRANMPMAKVTQQPIRESCAQLEAVNQRLTHEQSLEQQCSREEQQGSLAPTL